MSTMQLQQTTASADWDEDALARLAGTAAAGDEPFRDNLDHLSALEYEATLMLAVAFLRKAPPHETANPDAGTRFSELFSILPAGTPPAKVEQLLEEATALNRRKEIISERAGVDLCFPAFCRQMGLSPFERAAVMLLLMQFSSPRFMDTFRRCRLEAETVGLHTNDRNNGMLIGTLLFVICRNYREQVASRCHFSAESALIREEIVVSEGAGESTNFIASKVGLHERVVRRLLGDQNVYRSSLRFIRWERSAVNLDQVVLPDGLKEEIAACVGNFLDDRAAGRFEALDAFFGYGTGLALLFHGPPGTGKTMMARALASRFNRRIVSLAANVIDKYASLEDVLSRVFRQAESLGGIVLLDECDDLFENNSRLGRALLIELEKARCVVIMATNKPGDLDPAMERRVAMKVAFPVPDTSSRLRMWQALMPAGLELAPDIDLATIADRYQLSGGLIKNCFLLAMMRSPRLADGRICISRAQLERAVDLQSPAPSDEERICDRYAAPQVTIAELSLRNREKEGLQGAARAWQKLKGEGLGLTVLISTAFFATGQLAAKALARECGLEVRMFPYHKLQSSIEADLLVDPLTQRKISPMEYAFSRTLGANAMTLFMDFGGDLKDFLEEESNGKKNFYLDDLKARLRSQTGLFCMVTPSFKQQPLPVEFDLHFSLEHPPEHVQIRRWEERLVNDGTREDDLVTLVERWPMHVEEIDFIARQAAIQVVIRGGKGRPGLAEVREVIGRYRSTVKSPVLFGGS